MWYFTWILGVLLAVAFGIINVMWLEAEQCLETTDDEQDND
jgi:cyd operon protein YbgT